MEIIKPTVTRSSVAKNSAAKKKMSEQIKKSEQLKLQRKNQKKESSRKKKGRTRGAVIQRPNQQQESKAIVLKKKISDMLTEFGRLSGSHNPAILVLTLLVITLSVGVLGFKSLKAEMPIERVTVQGDFYQIDKSALEQTLAPLVGTNYVDVNIEAMKAKVMVFAWVQSVQVRKVWPASLEVRVVENRAIATWGEDGYVNEFGKVFKPKNVNLEYLVGLPDLNGLDKQSDLVLNTYVELSELSHRSQLKISQFSLLANSYWKVTFHQGSEILLAKGRELNSLKTFLDVYEQQLSKSEQHLARVDMRYNNGFSVEFSESKELEKKIVEVGLKESKTTHKVEESFLKSTEKVGKHHG